MQEAADEDKKKMLSDRNVAETKDDVAETKDDPDVTKRADVRHAVGFWEKWLKRSAPHPARDGSGTLKEKSNASWIVESAFDAYLVAKRQGLAHIFLLATDVPEQNGVHLAAGSKADLEPIASFPKIQRYMQTAPDPAYYLLLLRKDEVLLAFRKRLNPAPYVLATGDVDSIIDFDHVIGTRSPLPTNHLLMDDE